MSLTSGFYNSIGGDRRYNAQQMSEVFNGIINDGIFASIGTAFAVSADTGNNIKVGIGRAWFNGTWIYNDSIMSMKASDPHISLGRIDAVVLEVNHEERNAFIKIITGYPSGQPENPKLTNNEYVHQYPLAYINRPAGSNGITQSNIISMIGTSNCPFVTGILKVLAIDSIVAQWEAQWIQWLSDITSNTNDRVDQLISEKTREINTWFTDLQVMLEGDVAANLASEILELRNRVDTLEKEHFPMVEDSNGDAIQDSNGDVIGSKILYEGKIV